MGGRMAATEGPLARTERHEEEIAPFHILWINAGLSCDGESVALTAATQPSIEDIVGGGLPGLPTLALHWPFLDYECGPEHGPDSFIEWFHKGARGELGPFLLVIEGSIPNEALKKEGYWCGFGNNAETGQPMTTSEWIDRLAPKAWAVIAVGTCAVYGGVPPRAGIPTVCVPECPTHPDNLSETLLYLLYQVAGQAPMIPLDELLRPRWLFAA